MKLVKSCVPLLTLVNFPKLTPRLKWVQVLLGEQQDHDALLLWAPFIGVAVHLLGYGIKIMSRVAAHRANQKRIESTHLAMEAIVGNVLGELSRCLGNVDLHRKRFEVIAQMLKSLEDVLRAMDNFQLSRTISKFSYTNVPEQILAQLEEQSTQIQEFSMKEDLDVICEQD